MPLRRSGGKAGATIATGEAAALLDRERGSRWGGKSESGEPLTDRHHRPPPAGKNIGAGEQSLDLSHSVIACASAVLLILRKVPVCSE
jgi:hypothetical protein